MSGLQQSGGGAAAAHAAEERSGSGSGGPLSAEEAAPSLRQSHAADSTHANMSDENSAAPSSTSDVAATPADASAALQTQPTAGSQTQSQPDPIAVGSMSVDELIQSIALVPAHPPDEFVRRQLGLLLRLGELLRMRAESVTTAALSVEQALAVLQMALRVEATGEHADVSVSDNSRAPL